MRKLKNDKANRARRVARARKRVMGQESVAPPKFGTKDYWRAQADAASKAMDYNGRLLDETNAVRHYLQKRLENAYEFEFAIGDKVFVGTGGVIFGRSHIPGVVSGMQILPEGRVEYLVQTERDTINVHPSVVSRRSDDHRVSFPRESRVITSLLPQQETDSLKASTATPEKSKDR